ncbi:MAG: Fic family protein [Acidimicrobiia bacterium]
MLIADAEAALGRLAGAGRLLPDPHLLVQPYLRREAVASTRIEGTQASLVQVFDAEAGDGPLGADVEEVVNYVRAMELGLQRLETLPLSTRLIREMHGVILAGVRGRDRQPGELRITQNWIGSAGATVESATFVPPPPAEIGELLSDLEYFVHEDPQLPPLVQGALVHYQFETINPFLDGNGRIGRLLIVFFLVVRERLPAPLLYLSPFLEARRQEYYEALQAVRQRGDLDGWLNLFLDGIHTQANDALARAERLSDLRERYRRSVQAKTRGGANRLVDLVFEQPIVNARTVERRLGLTRPSALNALRQLEDLGVLAAAREGPRGQLRWRAEEVLRLLVTDED